VAQAAARLDTWARGSRDSVLGEDGDENCAGPGWCAAGAMPLWAAGLGCRTAPEELSEQLAEILMDQIASGRI
jgi:hypothetical protein